MKNLSIFTVIATALMYQLAVASFMVIGPDGGIPNVVDRQRDLLAILGLFSHAVMLAVFAAMFFCKFHKGISLLGGFGAICGILTALFSIRFYHNNSLELTDHIFDSTLWDSLSTFYLVCTLIAFSLIYVELRQDRTFQKLALIALVLYILSILMTFLSHSLLFSYSSKPSVIFIQKVSLLLPDLAQIIYFLALSLAFMRAARPALPQEPPVDQV